MAFPRCTFCNVARRNFPLYTTVQMVMVDYNCILMMIWVGMSPQLTSKKDFSTSALFSDTDNLYILSYID